MARRNAMRLAVMALAGFLLLGSAGCSWLIGVSDDPVVVDESDARDEDAGLGD